MLCILSPENVLQHVVSHIFPGNITWPSDHETGNTAPSIEDNTATSSAVPSLLPPRKNKNLFVGGGHQTHGMPHTALPDPPVVDSLVYHTTEICTVYEKNNEMHHIHRYNIFLYNYLH